MASTWNLRDARQLKQRNWESRGKAVSGRKLMIDKLTNIGFRDVYYLSPELAQERYFAGRSDKLTTPRVEQLVAATV